MIIYFATLVFITLCCSMAELVDKPSRGRGLLGPVRHMGAAWLFFVCAAAVLIGVAGLRYRVGTDFGAYYLNYQSYIDTLKDKLRALDEPGYGIVAMISTKLYKDGAAAIFGASLITIGLPLVIIYRNSEQLLLPTVLLVITGFWHGSFNGVRQYLAAAVLFSGYRFLEEEDLIRYLIVTLMAFLCHRSAIVMALLYFAVHREVNIENILLMIVIAGVALFSYDRIFDIADAVMDKDYSTDNSYTSTAVNRLRILSSFVPAGLFLTEYWDKPQSRAQRLFLNITIVHAAIRMVTMNSALLYRIGIYTTPFMALAISGLLLGMSPDRRRVYTTLIITMYAIMWWYEISISASLNNFQWIWSR